MDKAAPLLACGVIGLLVLIVWVVRGKRPQPDMQQQSPLSTLVRQRRVQRTHKLLGNALQLLDVLLLVHQQNPCLPVGGEARASKLLNEARASLRNRMRPDMTRDETVQRHAEGDKERLVALASFFEEVIALDTNLSPELLHQLERFTHEFPRPPQPDQS